jgi:hypothetical protein
VSALRCFLSAALWSLAACALPARVAVNPRVDFTKIRVVSLPEAVRDDQRGVIDEFARQLMARGYDVRFRSPGAAADGSDARLEVNLTQMIADKKYLVPLTGGKDNTAFVLSPVTEISGRTLMPSATGVGLEDAQVMVSNATVGLSARLMSPAGGELWWAAALTYEGLDLDAAVEGCVSGILKKWPAP